MSGLRGHEYHTEPCSQHLGQGHGGPGSLDAPHRGKNSQQYSQKYRLSVNKKISLKIFPCGIKISSADPGDSCEKIAGEKHRKYMRNLAVYLRGGTEKRAQIVSLPENQGHGYSGGKKGKAESHFTEFPGSFLFTRSPGEAEKGLAAVADTL